MTHPQIATSPNAKQPFYSHYTRNTTTHGRFLFLCALHNSSRMSYVFCFLSFKHQKHAIRVRLAVGSSAVFMFSSERISSYESDLVVSPSERSARITAELLLRPTQCCTPHKLTETVCTVRLCLSKALRSAETSHPGRYRSRAYNELPPPILQLYVSARMFIHIHACHQKA